MFQSTKLLQSRKVALDGALAHRQSLRHLFASDCWRLFDEIKYSLLTLSEFRLRHISVRVSDILCVGGGKDYGLELSGSRFENRLQFVFISFQCFGLIADACESATSFLHIVKLSHHVCKYGITPFRRHIFDVQILYQQSIVHTTRRGYRQSIIINIQMHLATHHGIVTMNEVVNHCFKNGTLCILRFILSSIGQFLPAFLCI